MEDNEIKTETTVTQEAGKGDKKPFLIVFIVFILLAVGAYFLIGMGESDDELVSDEMMQQNDAMLEEDGSMTQDENMEDEELFEEEEALVEDGDVKVVQVEGGSYYFEPDVIEVAQGDTIRIVLSSADMMHDFVIDELGVATPVVQSGDSGEVEFTVDLEPGEYEFYCSVGDHRARGMVGTLVVI